MRRIRIAIIGAGPLVEWTILPALSGPDATTPPDNGAWWVRRPTAHSDIPYQPAARPEVVALADENGDGERVSRIATAARIKAAYADWRVLLREVEADAVICVVSPPLLLQILSDAQARGRRFWVEGAPAASPRDAQRLARIATSQGSHIWLARPWRLAAGHRVARRLLDQGEIGTVSALALRWGSAFTGHFVEENASVLRSFSSTYAALDLVLYFASGRNNGLLLPDRVSAATAQGSTSVWMHLTSGASATALFSATENWSSSLPRLEICGTAGRTMTCESSRRVWLQQPREAARLLEPPGAAAHISAANILGLAEDLKVFLAWCADTRVHDISTSNYFEFANTAAVLSTLQTIEKSLSKQHEIMIKPLSRDDRNNADATPLADNLVHNTTLPLQL